MKILDNNLDTCIETWEDPGDYPSGAGGGPLPSYPFVADISGTVTVSVSDAELTAWAGCPVKSTMIRDTIAEYVAASGELLNAERPSLVAEIKSWTITSIHPSGWVWGRRVWSRFGDWIWASVSLNLLVNMVVNFHSSHPSWSATLGLLTMVAALMWDAWVDRHPLTYTVTLSVHEFESDEVEDNWDIGGDEVDYTDDTYYDEK